MFNLFSIFPVPIFFVGLARNLCPNPPKPSKSRFSRKPPSETTQRRQNQKVAQRERGPDEPKSPENSPVAPSYGPNSFLSVGSLTDKTGRQRTKCPRAPPKIKWPYPRPQGHMGPQTGFTGSAFGMQTTLVGGHLAQNGPQDRENPLFGVFGQFQALNGAAKFL